MKRENIETIYELSPLQQGILLHTLAEPQSGMYVQQFSWTIQGAHWDAGALTRYERTALGGVAGEASACPDTSALGP